MNALEWSTCLAVAVAIGLAPRLWPTPALADQPAMPLGVSLPAGAIDWHDGDSGRIGDQRFRLEGIDAPETGGVGSMGGAKCEAERAMGAVARDRVQALTDASVVHVFALYEDRFGRTVARMWAGSEDIAAWGVREGLYGVWPHDPTGRALAAKPEWCGQ